MHTNEILFSYKTLNCNPTLDAVEHRESSCAFQDWYPDFVIVKAKEDFSHKNIIQNGRNTFRTILEIVENFVLNPSQPYLNYYFMKLNSETYPAFKSQTF